VAIVTAEQDIGTRLRGIRRMKKLRLKDVAAKIDCSESMLSKIETNKAQPSLKMLHRLTEVLGTTIASLFADHQDGTITIHRQGQRALVVTRAAEDGGTVSLERISPFGEDQMLEVNIHIVDPGTESGGDISHTGEEVGYVLEGELDLIVEDESHALSAGDSFYFRSELRHRYRNTGTGRTRILWINTPVTF